MPDTILARHKLVYNPMAGEDWCRECNEPWRCATLKMYDRAVVYEAALRRILEMDTLIDIQEFAHGTLAANGATDLPRTDQPRLG